ncbi:MAG: GAF domain-containing protein [Silicimonas sp.]|nr:GAF domain-containing protein [Silicimonas sp.]
MGLEKEKTRQTFGPQDLGILDTPPSRALRTVVELCAHALKSPVAALFIFDDAAGELFLNTAVGLETQTSGGIGLPLSGSLASHVRSENRVVRIDNLLHPPFDTSVEHMRFGAQSFIGGVVCGPMDDPIGVLAAMHRGQHNWTLQEAKLVGDMAYLISQQIMLKASFATLKIISAERRVHPI